MTQEEQDLIVVLKSLVESAHDTMVSSGYPDAATYDTLRQSKIEALDVLEIYIPDWTKQYR